MELAPRRAGLPDLPQLFGVEHVVVDGMAVPIQLANDLAVCGLHHRGQRHHRQRAQAHVPLQVVREDPRAVLVRRRLVGQPLPRQGGELVRVGGQHRQRAANRLVAPLRHLQVAFAHRADPRVHALQHIEEVCHARLQRMRARAFLHRVGPHQHVVVPQPVQFLFRCRRRFLDPVVIVLALLDEQKRPALGRLQRQPHKIVQQPTKDRLHRVGEERVHAQAVAERILLRLARPQQPMVAAEPYLPALDVLDRIAPLRQIQLPDRHAPPFHKR